MTTLFNPTGAGRLVAYEQGNTPPVFPRKVLYFGSRPTEWVSLFRRETRAQDADQGSKYHIYYGMILGFRESGIGAK